MKINVEIETDSPEYFTGFTKIFSTPNLGFLIFGAEYGSSIDRVYNIVLNELGRSNNLDRELITVLKGDIACDHQKRHEAVMALLEKGVEGVVGVYTKVDPASVESGDHFADVYERQVKALIDNPPSPDGLVYLITVTEEK